MTARDWPASAVDLVARLADILLGAYCPRGCGLRVYPRDHCAHRYACPNSPHRKDQRHG